jgi:predicted deacetylase
MLKANFIWRIDDVCPGMDRLKFDKYLNLFRRYGVVPLLGVVPENCDPELTVQSEGEDFWNYLYLLKEQGLVEIAQHGYQHILYEDDGALMGKIYGFNGLTEFSGLTYIEQERKILQGKSILESRGLLTNVWIAPAHSFDNNTILALRNNGFMYISDGIGLFPMNSKNICFVPQQIWRPRKFPVGFWTVCLHLNHSSELDYLEISKFLEDGVISIRFSDATKFKNNIFTDLSNYLFRLLYILIRKIK